MGSPAAGTRPGARLRPASWAALPVGAAVVASVLAGASAALPVLLGTSVTRAGMDVAGVACVGLTLVGVLLTHDATTRSHDTARAARRAEDVADRAVLVLSAAWLLLVLLGVAFRTADAFGRPIGGITVDQVVQWSTRLAAGRGMVLTAVCTAVVVGCAVARVRAPDRLPVRIPLVAALIGVLTPAVTGHAGSAAVHELSVITMALHVGAAALWVGGLGALLLLVAGHRHLLDAALPRFSRLAGLCLAVVTLTGVVTAVIRVQTWDALLGTGYGWLVVAKVVCLVLLGGLGALARRRLATGRTPVLRWAGAETALMAVTLGIASALTQTG